MNERMLAVKLWITTFCTAISAALGRNGIMAVLWVFVMLLDYLSGSAAACRTGRWSSAAARQGLWHKDGMILVVAVAAISDYMISVVWPTLPMGVRFPWPGVIFPLVLAWYIITELGSILENAIQMGANVPDWLAKMLKTGLTAVDRAGTAAADTEKEDVK